MPAVHPNLYAILDGLAIVDGDLAAADRYDALHIARERELDRPAPSNYIAKVYAQLGSYCLSRGQYDRASRLFSKAVAAEPKVADHYRHLADALQKLGDARQAERIEQRLRELEAGRR
jgi:tetratricopeptide (TPR) repeat protein